MSQGEQASNTPTFDLLEVSEQVLATGIVVLTEPSGTFVQRTISHAGGSLSVEAELEKSILTTSRIKVVESALRTYDASGGSGLVVSRRWSEDYLIPDDPIGLTVLHAFRRVLAAVEPGKRLVMNKWSSKL